MNIDFTDEEVILTFDCTIHNWEYIKTKLGIWQMKYLKDIQNLMMSRGKKG